MIQTATSPKPADLALLIEVALLYYEEGRTQAEIGRHIGTSRSTVSRLLQEARARGVVQISIDYSLARDSHLERQLQARFALKEVRVLRSFGHLEDEVVSGLGQLAASYLEEVIEDGMTVGVSYGRSVASAVQRVKPKRLADLVVLQVIGALGSGNPLQDGPDLARQLANAYGGAYRYLHAPLLVESARMRELLSQEPLVKDLLQTAKKADLVLMGVSPLTADAAGLIFRDYLSKADLARLGASGAVGHMCAQFFGADGELIDTPFNERAITIGLETLRTVREVVTVAGGSEKARAILGVLRGGYIDVLVTDDTAVREVLAQA